MFARLRIAQNVLERGRKGRLGEIQTYNVNSHSGESNNLPTEIKTVALMNALNALKERVHFSVKRGVHNTSSHLSMLILTHIKNAPLSLQDKRRDAWTNRNDSSQRFE